MTWKDEDIDKLFQDASKEKTFEFKEEYWDEMESMLPKKKKRKFPFIWIFSSIVITSSIAAILFFNTDEQVQTSQTDFPSTNQKNSTSSSLKNTENKLETNTTTSQTESTIKTSSTIEAEKNSLKRVTKNQKNSKINHSVNTSTFTDIHPTTPSIINGIITPSIIKSGIDAQTSEPINPIVQVKNAEKIGAITLLSIPENNYEHTLQVSALKSISPLYKWSMFFDISTSMGQGAMVTSSGSNFYSGFGFGTGINYTSGMWNLNFGINANLTSSRNLVVSERQKIHGFGVDVFENNYTYKQIYQIDFPLLVGVKKRNQTFQFGLVPSVYMGAKVLKESTNNDQTIIANSEYGYFAGTANFGLKPTIGYMYRLTPSVQIGGNIQMQLINQTVQNYFDGNQRHLPLNGQIFIRKSLVIK